MFTLNCQGRLLVVDKPLVMGIINVTPDSFFSGSRFNGDALVQQAGRLLAEGAAILDIGGQSTRPGSERVSEKEEAARVLPAIRQLLDHFPEAFLSIDTYYASVARQAVEAGVAIVNDISGGSLDPELLPAVASLGSPYICMHMRGTPDTMQEQTDYTDVTREVLDHFIALVARLEALGIRDIIIDPGFGFAKTLPQNYELLRNLSLLKMLGKPLLVGVSRKGMIYRQLGITADAALNGTTVLNTVGLMNGASILRVHDVKEAVEAVKLWEAVKVGTGL
ncbi:MAG: dihydropteroate synthase [Candidatus Pseudobacter hemicellulosilyticus]|uniref:dihydropteroate synthase n=1 Tax=Candidatus Pseudobacter hemicellulosilyticus TaxID=3121375 RepID=A0AAJ6BF14_9BACT|nr:MAG: dihydropteroate synthase [Pseudobacter sp.]